MQKTMESRYQPKDFEDRIYQAWMDQDCFKAKVDWTKQPYTIVLPPPNITGQLHMGHALDHTLQDVLIRWKRMQGFEALWLPGTDHASIATEVKVLEKIREEEGISKEELGRDEVLKRAWAWKEVYGDRIVVQMKKLGNSCDWSRERFTMDEGCNKAVTEVFIRLHEKGLIYRGYRMINWCPDCMTSLSDAEVEFEEKSGAFYHIKYFLKDSEDYLEIATTRPETLLGDTGVAVNPDDPRYSKYIGKTVILPLVGKEIPIVADHHVDIELGTGALKVTPSHDPNDFEIGQRHNLEHCIIMNKDATINHNGGKYEGMDRYDARKAIVKDLEAQGHMVDIKPHLHNVGICYRCSTVVEPMMSDQWFVSMKSMAEPAMAVIDDKQLEFVPERYTKIYQHWLENIRDWCISRQLWWGHRIPAYYCQGCDEIVVAREMPQVCKKCGSNHFVQDEDVLDTWFSSALWPFSTLGWPDETPEMKYFYPTDVLVTAYDIIFFWVVRMVFSALEQLDEVPFKYVFIHGLIRAADGSKMSKSSGNGVDPLDIIDQYGADALRFMLVTGNSPGADMKFQIERVEASRNFSNKLWNASRFVISALDDKSYEMNENMKLELADRWILSRLQTVTEEVTRNLDKFAHGHNTGKPYRHTERTYSSHDNIELTKKRLYGDDETAKETVKAVLLTFLKSILKLLHPFIPFITEEIWQHIPETSSKIMLDTWPVMAEGYVDPAAEKDMNLLMEAIKALRNVRAEMDVPPSRKARLLVLAEISTGELLLENADYLRALSSASDVIIVTDRNEIPDDSVAAVIEGAEIFMPLDDLIDYKKEMDRLSREKAKLQQEIDRVIAKLANEGFVAKAPEKLILEEQEKQKKFTEMLEKVSERLEVVTSKLN